uniref:Uncharacterized protein n=1 Tax=Heliothis virescens TaxID=7102 RepID=A0A2A4JQJ0_HELVI
MSVKFSNILFYLHRTQQSATENNAAEEAAQAAAQAAGLPGPSSTGVPPNPTLYGLPPEYYVRPAAFVTSPYPTFFPPIRVQPRGPVMRRPANTGPAVINTTSYGFPPQ